MSQVRIQASEQLVSKVFSNDYIFDIPPYQRPYKWGIEQAEQLLDDLLDWMGDGDHAVSKIAPYFLGSIVLIKPFSEAVSSVVDGQQRLTTLTILFAALRETIEDPEYRESLTGFLYQKGNVALGTQNQYRLTLREQDADFFRRYIQDQDGLAQMPTGSILPDSQARLRENALRLRDRLKVVPERQRQRLIEMLSRRCYLVVVATEDSGSAFRIFSVLNDRGLDLTHADILKADVIGAMEKHVQEKYTKKWEEAEDDLGQEAFKDLFSHIRMIYNPTKLRRTILEEVREYVKPRDNPREFVDRVLLPYADAYETILASSYESTHSAEQVNQVLKWLKRVDNNDWQPPAILYLARHGDNTSAVLQFLKDLDRLAYGLMILRANITTRISRYAKVITAIQENADLYTATSPLQLTKDECDDIVKVLDGPIYDLTVVRLPVLLRLDEVFSGGVASYDHNVLTIEHVLPQNPADGSQWLTWFPDERQRQTVVHRLGNLALLSRKKNSQARNYEFERKKREYFDRKGGTPFPLTTQVLQESEWTPSVFAARQAKHVAALKNLWRL